MDQNTFNLDKNQLIQRAFDQMEKHVKGADYTPRQKLALTCRILFDNGHDSGLAGQITARADQPDAFLTQRLGLGLMKLAQPICYWSMNICRY